MTGYEAVQTDAAWLDLSARGKLFVMGEDRARLLHAMCSNDVKSLAEGNGLYAFFLTSQGRILADAHLYNRGDALFLDTEPETGDKLREHLDKYIIADDAAIEPAEGWSCLGIEGPNALSRAAALGLPIPEKPYGTQSWQDGFVAHVSTCWPVGVRVFAPGETVGGLMARTADFNLPQLSPDDARVVRLENGIPRYGEDISERYLVQETGQLRAVHFNKGCYLGQEIVERVRSRAQVHRHLHSIRIKTSVPPAPGTKLVIDGKDVAEITSAAFSPRLDLVVALAYVRIEALQNPKGLMVAGSAPPAEAYLVAGSSGAGLTTHAG